ncbi:hypothetical protein MAR_008466, partial [Mya arenaria]
FHPTGPQPLNTNSTLSPPRHQIPPKKFPLPMHVRANNFAKYVDGYGPDKSSFLLKGFQSGCCPKESITTLSVSFMTCHSQGTPCQSMTLSHLITQHFNVRPLIQSPNWFKMLAEVHS